MDEMVETDVLINTSLIRIYLKLTHFPQLDWPGLRGGGGEG